MIDHWVEKFKQEAVPKIITEFKPEQIFIFGSRIKGGATEDSDLDVIVVAEAFFNIPFVKRRPMVLKKVRFEKHIDFMCYSPVELQKIKNQSAILMDALEYSLKIV